jgi:hypothetical protein
MPELKRKISMNKWFGLVCMLGCLCLAGCQSDGGGVTQKVLADFGIGEHPEGYVSGSDKVYQQLDTVGQAEMKRMNAEGREGQIKFEQDGLKGRYFKEVKRYESAHPVDVKASTASADRGFVGFIEYECRLFHGAAKPTRAEAAAQSAEISTETVSREMMRYNFSVAGTWDGGKGERSSQ